MHYQKLRDEWKASVRKMKSARLSMATPAEPPMFAFCIRPLGLQLERPQKKLLPSSQSHGGSCKSGRRLSACASRDRGASVSRLNHLNSTGVSASQFSGNHQAVSPLSHNQTVLTGKRKRPASFDMPDRMNPASLPSNDLGFLREDVEGFKKRDAHNDALHAINMTRVKRAKTQLLMQKADLASFDMPNRMNPTMPSYNLGFLKEDLEGFKARDAQNAALLSASEFSDNHQAVSPRSHNQTVLTGKRKPPASFDMPDRMNPTSLPSDDLGFLKEDVEGFKARDAQNDALHAVNMARVKRAKTELLMQKADLASFDVPERMNPTSLPSDNLGFLKEDLDDFKMRDAQNAALHAANMARLMRLKAELLMQKADLTMYQARYALMMADAIESSTPKCNGAG